jgi:hypothetical protein
VTSRFAERRVIVAVAWPWSPACRMEAEAETTRMREIVAWPGNVTRFSTFCCQSQSRFPVKPRRLATLLLEICTGLAIIKYRLAQCRSHIARLVCAYLTRFPSARRTLSAEQRSPTESVSRSHPG